ECMPRAITISFAFAIILAALPLAVRSRMPSRPTPQDSPSTTAYLGFDRNIYPGDDALPILRKTYAYSGYWISPPPGEKINTWSGKHQLLQSHGFGFLVLYPGRESRERKTTAQAAQESTQDAAEAIANAEKEGFPKATAIFIDIEEGGRLPATYHAYLR